MSEFKLERSMWDKEQYYYLSKEDSILYDKIKDSDDPKEMEIKRLILDKAKASRGAHCSQTR